ncbi:MAG TPA: hypothetical protein VJV78_08810 [Polyangiales bacterium]|nr:hypothetical protein [Polyangiales bacterium]
MDKDMLTTFDDDAMDQVSGGVDPVGIGTAVGTLIGQSIKDHWDAAANRFERWGTFLSSLSTAIRS